MDATQYTHTHIHKLIDIPYVCVRATRNGDDDDRNVRSVPSCHGDARECQREFGWWRWRVVTAFAAATAIAADCD